MTIRGLFKRVEGLVGQLPAPARPDDWLTEEDWPGRFEAWGRAGLFAGEPDFPAVLAGYRRALAQARSRADPPFDPPADFMSNLADLPHLRLLNWRNRFRIPEVHAAWEWLAELHHRTCTGIPPVIEAEFNESAGWFRDNDDRLARLCQPSGLLELGNGRRITAANLRYGLARGPGVPGAGELAEELRRLKARYGGGDP
jgi:hypothetical protein